MYSTRTGVVIWALVALSFAASMFYWNRLPEEMASHWGPSGMVDGWSSRGSGAFFLPVLLAVIAGAFAIFPRLGPAPVTPATRRHVGGFVIALLAFLNVLHLQMIQWNIGNEISFAITVPVSLGVFFFYLGIVLGSVEPNWIVGIRTYWTLKDPRVWAHTHERASRLFKILGFIYVGAAFFRDYILLFILLPGLFVALYLVAYSFLVYRQINPTDD